MKITTMEILELTTGPRTTRPWRIPSVWIGHLLAYALMVLWFHTGYDKLQDLRAFEVALGRQPLPAWSLGVLVYAVPALEIAAGLLLLLPRTRRIGFWLSLLLMAAFTTYVALGLGGALGHLPCSCSKIISHLSWKQHLYFNIGFLLAAAVGAITTYPRLIARISNTWKINRNGN